MAISAEDAAAATFWRASEVMAHPIVLLAHALCSLSVMPYPELAMSFVVNVSHPDARSSAIEPWIVLTCFAENKWHALFCLVGRRTSGCIWTIRKGFT